MKRPVRLGVDDDPDLTDLVAEFIREVEEYLAKQAAFAAFLEKRE